MEDMNILRNLWLIRAACANRGSDRLQIHEGREREVEL